MRFGVILQSWSLLTEHVQNLLGGAGQTMLDLLLAMVVLIVGWLLAAIAASIVLWLLRTVRFNDVVRRVFGEGPPFLHEPARVAAWVAQWTLIVLAVMLAADVLGFELSHSVANRLRDVLPRVVAATIVLAIGVAIAMFLGGLARRVFAGVGLKGSRVRGQAVTIVLTCFAVLLSLEQLGLAAQFIIALGLTGVAAVGLGAALAFGLGCRDLARDFVVEYLRSLDEERPPRP